MVMFYCQDNLLTDLVGCPKKVSEFSCDNNRLTSLIGCPVSVGGNFFVIIIN